MGYGMGALVGLAAVVFLELIAWTQWLALGTREKLLISGFNQDHWWRRMAAPVVGGRSRRVDAGLTPTCPAPRGGLCDRGVGAAAGNHEFPRRDQGGDPQWDFVLARPSGARDPRCTGRHHWRLARALGLDPRVPDPAGLRGSAAVAASFNAPLAGVFFALEVVVGHYAFSVFAPCVLAALTATLVGRAAGR